MNNVFLITNVPFIACGMIPFTIPHFIQQPSLSVHEITRILRKNLSIAIPSPRTERQQLHDQLTTEFIIFQTLFLFIHPSQSIFILYLRFLNITQHPSNHFQSRAKRRLFYYYFRWKPTHRKKSKYQQLFHRIILLTEETYLTKMSSHPILYWDMERTTDKSYYKPYHLLPETTNLDRGKLYSHRLRWYLLFSSEFLSNEVEFLYRLVYLVFDSSSCWIIRTDTTEWKPSDETLQQGRNLDRGKLYSHRLRWYLLFSSEFLSNEVEFLYRLVYLVFDSSSCWIIRTDTTEWKPSDETLQQGRNLDRGKLYSHRLRWYLLFSSEFLSNEVEFLYRLVYLVFDSSSCWIIRTDTTEWKPSDETLQQGRNLDRGKLYSPSPTLTITWKCSFWIFSL